MARWRTLDAGYELLKKEDPDTCITRWALRAMMIEGVIPTLMIGKKRLFDVDDVDNVLKAGFNIESYVNGKADA